MERQTTVNCMVYHKGVKCFQLELCLWGWKEGIIFIRVVREGPIEEITLEQIFEGKDLARWISRWKGNWMLI